MTEQDLAALSFKAAAHDMEQIVRHIADRYLRLQVPLTWRLLHAIEAEALADLGFAARHEPFICDLFARPADFDFPETDDPIDVGRSNALPAVLSFAVAAFERPAAAATPRQSRIGRSAPRVRTWRG